MNKEIFDVIKSKIRGNDVIGFQFGRLTVISYNEKTNLYKSICTCGKEREDLLWYLRNLQSCGCLIIEKTIKRNITHGMVYSPEYKAWESMKSRCKECNKKSKSTYFNRGIGVCKEWIESFQAFYDHIGPRPSSKFSLERIDNDCGYEPGNVKWAIFDEQKLNKTNTKFETYKGEVKSLHEWCSILNRDYSIVFLRLQRFWTIDRALEEPTPKPYQGRGFRKYADIEDTTIKSFTKSGEMLSDTIR